VEAARLLELVERLDKDDLQNLKAIIEKRLKE
jgi:hypothetical protein